MLKICDLFFNSFSLAFSEKPKAITAIFLLTSPWDKTFPGKTTESPSFVDFSTSLRFISVLLLLGPERIPAIFSQKLEPVFLAALMVSTSIGLPFLQDCFSIFVFDFMVFKQNSKILLTRLTRRRKFELWNVYKDLPNSFFLKICINKQFYFWFLLSHQH